MIARSLKTAVIAQTGLDLAWLASESESESKLDSKSPRESDRLSPLLPCANRWKQKSHIVHTYASLEAPQFQFATAPPRPAPPSLIQPRIALAILESPAVGRYAMAMPCNFSQVTKWIACRLAS